MLTFFFNAGICVIITSINVKGRLMLVTRNVHTLGASVRTGKAFAWKPSQKHASAFPHGDAILRFPMERNECLEGKRWRCGRANLPQVDSNFVSRWGVGWGGHKSHRQSSQGKLALSGAEWAGLENQVQGAHLVQRRNSVRTSQTLYCFLSAGIEAGARDKNKQSHTSLPCLKFPPANQKESLKWKVEKGIHQLWFALNRFKSTIFLFRLISFLYSFFF